MSYIDNQRTLAQLVTILEMENEYLRKQIKDLKKKNNELLDDAVIKNRTESEQNEENRK